MQMDTDEKSILKCEVDAAEGSFVATLRYNLRWDREKFVQLCEALHSAAKANVGKPELPRELSQLFWYCGTFLPMWLEQRDFRVGQPEVDHDRANKLLKALGNEWFGEDCLIDDDDFKSQLGGI